MLANRRIFDKNRILLYYIIHKYYLLKIDDEKYIKAIENASEWIMKEKSILYRGSSCGIFDEMKNDLSYNVYKKLKSLPPKYYIIIN